jgi:hypothetical protein
LLQKNFGYESQSILSTLVVYIFEYLLFFEIMIAIRPGEKRGNGEYEKLRDFWFGFFIVGGGVLVF